MIDEIPLKFPPWFSEVEVKSFWTWFHSRPKIVRQAILKNPPFGVYKMEKTPGFYYTIESYDSCESSVEVRVKKWRERTNELVCGVFGVDPITLRRHEREAELLEALRRWS